MTSDEASREDLIFPHPRSISKVPKDLSPEEVAAECPWLHGKGNVTVCLTNEKFGEDIDSILDVEGIHRVIYDRSTPDEQIFLQCAAALGNAFTRHMLQTILPHPAALYTAHGKFDDFSLKRIVEFMQFFFDDSEILIRFLCKTDVIQLYSVEDSLIHLIYFVL